MSNKPPANKTKEQLPIGLARYLDTYFSNLWSFVGINLLFLISCVPIVTIGPACIAMSRICCDALRGRNISFFSSYISYFKKNLRQGLLLSFTAFPLLGWLYYYTIAAALSLNRFAIFVVLLIASIYITAVVGYVLLLAGHMELPLLSVLKNALILSVAGKQYTIVAGLSTVAILFGHLLYLPKSLPLFLLCAFIFIAYNFCFFGWKVTDQYIFIPYYTNHPQEGVLQGYQ